MSIQFFTEQIQRFGDQLVHVDRFPPLSDIREKSANALEYFTSAHAGIDNRANATACLM